NFLLTQAKYEALRKADPNSKKMSLTAKHQKYCEAVKEIMDPIVLSVRPLHPLKVWEDISPQFLVSFWSLTMYDLFVPVESYQREVNKLKQLSLQVMDSKDTAVSKLKKEQERYTSLMEKLQEEKKKQQEHVEKVMVRLKQDCSVTGDLCHAIMPAYHSSSNKTLSVTSRNLAEPRLLHVQ
ncbi:unnamed protein product, partial [Timema podura]|nr:unnamed protein product [Timema podura]